MVGCHGHAVGVDGVSVHLRRDDVMVRVSTMLEINGINYMSYIGNIMT